MTKDEIEEARVDLTQIILALADAGAAMGKSARDVEAVRCIAPLAIDKLCDMALKALRPEGRGVSQLTIDEIMNAAIEAADALDATRVSELRAGKWHATTIFDGDAGLIRFGRLVEKAVRDSCAPQSPSVQEK